MNQLLKIIVLVTVLSKGTCFSDQSDIKCTSDVLKQIYPNQNACVLQASIPEKLKDQSFIIYPTQLSRYNTERFNFNKRFNVFPKAIIIPETKEDLQKVLDILISEKLDFSVRSGGHCFESGSLSNDYILDLRNFNKIKILNDSISVGVGARLGEIIEALGKEDRAIPTGTCQSVGIGGLALGGGLGFLSRTYGLTSDAIESITFLSAENKIIEVDKDHYPDLFWALRGAGNCSYGIALEFKLKTFNVPQVSFFELKWDWDSHLFREIFAAWHKWISDLPNTINPSLEVRYANGQVMILLTGLKVGKEPFIEWENAFKNLNPKVSVHAGKYAEIASFWADSPSTPFAKIKSIISFEPISNTGLERTIEYMEELLGEKSNFVISLEFVALGGKLLEGDTSYYPRKGYEWWHQVANWNHQDQETAALESIRKFNKSVVPLVSKYSYSNDVDFDLENQYLEAYYGDHVKALIQIKNKYDPKDIFHWKQSIPLKY